MHIAKLLLLLIALPSGNAEAIPPEQNPNLIPPDHEPSLAEIEDFSQRKRSRRKPLTDNADSLLRYIPFEDRARILLCGKAILRLADPKSGMDLLVLRRCQNYYCPWCPASSHIKRTEYQAAKLASLSPARELRVINVVWTLPPPLHALVRYDPRGMKAFTAAVRGTIARAYHYRGAKGVKIDSAAWNELGAIRNLHAIGDRAEPWPKWAPHHDLLLAAYRRRGDKILEMPPKWPELYEHTSHKYRHELRIARPPKPPVMAVTSRRSNGLVSLDAAQGRSGAHHPRGLRARRRGPQRFGGPRADPRVSTTGRCTRRAGRVRFPGGDRAPGLRGGDRAPHRGCGA